MHPAASLLTFLPMPSPSDRLSRYRAKRPLERTPEPAGSLAGDPADKRLAVLVEDHPLEYGDFEGIIPAGNYGAGAVIVWDRGRWTPLEDPADGLTRGKLLFELHGIKLRGRWTLVKLKKGENEW